MVGTLIIFDSLQKSSVPITCIDVPSTQPCQFEGKAVQLNKKIDSMPKYGQGFTHQNQFIDSSILYSVS